VPLLVGDHPTQEEFVAAVQAWAAQIDGINAAERLTQLAGGLASVPTAQPGFLQPYAGSSAPSGWLMCDGSAISRTQYANLFAVIGVTYGVGDNVTTFNIPDLRQRFPLGKAASGTGSTLGSTGGAIDHTHTLSGSTANESSHTHGITTSGTHTHTISGTTQNFSIFFSSTNVDTNGDGTTVAACTGIGLSAGPGTVPASLGHTHGAGFLSGDAGGDHAHGGATDAGSAHSHAAGTLATATANPPYLAVNWIVKT
jgi:microcystin-dependent protein